jgi:hypothetical protein
MNAIMIAEYYSFIQQHNRQVRVHGGEPAVHPDTLLLLEDCPSWSMLLRMIWYGLASETRNLRSYERFGNMANGEHIQMVGRELSIRYHGY